MENLEEAARSAAERWKDRDKAKEELRVILIELKKTRNMSQISEIIGIQRTTLYYFLYGRDGKTNSTRRSHEHNLSVHDGSWDLRKSA